MPAQDPSAGIMVPYIPIMPVPGVQQPIAPEPLVLVQEEPRPEQARRMPDTYSDVWIYTLVPKRDMILPTDDSRHYSEVELGSWSKAVENRLYTVCNLLSFGQLGVLWRRCGLPVPCDEMDTYMYSLNYKYKYLAKIHMGDALACDIAFRGLDVSGNNIKENCSYTVSKLNPPIHDDRVVNYAIQKRMFLRVDANVHGFSRKSIPVIASLNTVVPRTDPGLSLDGIILIPPIVLITTVTVVSLVAMNRLAIKLKPVISALASKNLLMMSNADTELYLVYASHIVGKLLKIMEKTLVKPYLEDFYTTSLLALKEASRFASVIVDSVIRYVYQFF